VVGIESHFIKLEATSINVLIRNSIKLKTPPCP